MELLLVLAVSGLLVAPLLGWIVVSLKSQESVKERSSEATSTNVSTRYMTRDVARSSAVALGGTDCAGGTAGGTVLFTVVRLRPSSVSAVSYAIVDGPRGHNRLVRRECPTPGAPITDEVRLADRLQVPSAGWASAVTCGDRTGRTGDTCGVVTLEVKFASGRPLHVVATRRIGGPL